MHMYKACMEPACLTSVAVAVTFKVTDPILIHVSSFHAYAPKWFYLLILLSMNLNTSYLLFLFLHFCKRGVYLFIWKAERQSALQFPGSFPKCLQHQSWAKLKPEASNSTSDGWQKHWGPSSASSRTPAGGWIGSGAARTGTCPHGMPVSQAAA